MENGMTEHILQSVFYLKVWKLIDPFLQEVL